jgi:predicted transcriptional regulator
LTAGNFGAIIIATWQVKGMILKTRVFDLYAERYRNLSELAEAMELSVSQVYRVVEGKRNINRKFIIGAIKAFPGYKFDDLFYFVAEVPVVKISEFQQVG